MAEDKMHKDLIAQEALDKMTELINEVTITMFCHLDPDNKLSSRPMWTSTVDPDGTIWFFTGKDSWKTRGLKDGTDACLCYAHPGKNTYLSVHGTPTVTDDKAKMKELWNVTLKAWFPDGLDDPNITLIRVKPHSAEYWDIASSTIVVLFGMVKAIVTGKEADGGEHGDLTL